MYIAWIILYNVHYLWVAIFMYIYLYLAKELMLLNCGVGEDSWESLELQGDPISPS